ncbi:hypothetical protein FJ976_01540 [Mesorhizobium sp. B1-1-9]|uniref:hypothetical protein n=1 Tax=Mesorhizobium sp. B1-1-9 TaxID=2589975 RepID=UPI00112B4AD4|nr:hypothetical protein [Mesorhizobium sp. B1-1-9]TPN58621.1 hypothetical protein FJ976_01540 [Mesorhizobium sp. B1-1-9]
MPNTVQAAAEGMPEVNRRRLLLGLAAASTAAAACTVATAAHSAAPVENPELVRLGNTLAAIADEYRAARDARIAIIDKWSKVWPLAPDEIISDRQYGNGPIERDITGSGLYRKGAARCLVIYTCDDLDWYLTRAKRILKGKTIDKRSVGGLPDRDAWEDALDRYAAEYTAAAKYEAEKARILKASGYEAADRRKEAAATALINAIDGIMAQPETTMAGVMIKAQALAAWGLVTDWQRLLTLQAPAWGPALGASVLRIAGEA